MPSHPLLDPGVFITRFAAPLSTLTTPAWAPTTLVTDEHVKSAVRDLLRAGGFKPSGRSKPASEYLVAAQAENRFPAINAAVDACNVASLCSGLPISLVDLDRLEGDLRIDVCPMGSSHVFNASGQVLDTGGLLALFDAVGSTGTPVKDAQRTKTHDGTRATISIVWGTKALPGRTAATVAYYRALLESIEGATIEGATVEGATLEGATGA